MAGPLRSGERYFVWLLVILIVFAVIYVACGPMVDKETAPPGYSRFA